MLFIFCKPISTKKRFQPQRKLNETCCFTLYDKAENIDEKDWDSVLKDRNIFLARDYLQILENCSNSRLKPRYLIVYLKEKPCAIFYMQVVDFNVGIFKSLFGNTEEAAKNSVINNYIESNKEETILRLFTAGNNLISGAHGFMFDDAVESRQRTALITGIIDLIGKEEKLRNVISSILIKDFDHKLNDEDLLVDAGYNSFSVEPNMVIDLNQNTKNLDDYLERFSKKYRNRGKSILKAGASLERRKLDLSEIKNHETVLYNLYSQVFESAKFKLLKLPFNYFSEVKSNFPEIFQVVALFKEGTPVAFTSFFNLSNGILEAHYIGFDYALNKEYELYQNILYENIKQGLEHGSRRINLGRTAAEIKTTVGAVAEDLICYAKPQNTISKILMKTIIGFLQPGKWTPRNPFKEGVKD